MGGTHGRDLRRRLLWLVIVPVLVTVPALVSAPDSGAVGDGSEIGDLPASAGAQSSDARSRETVRAAGMIPVFAPDTDPDYAQGVMGALLGIQSEAQFTLHWAPDSTALNNGGGLQGDALELTWSVIPDGTIMPAQFGGDTTCASNLIATFNAVYGAGVWQAEMQNVWNDWTGKTGNVYTPAVALNGNGTPIDDGAAWPASSGVAGVRGDLRIGGCTIDGNFNILAYNFLPSFGDMKIESMDAFFSGNPITPHFHNVFSHEHGHGAGLLHVCPDDNTKLMEPVINLAFTGLQHDDIRGIQRGYGDRFEVINNPNDTQGAATVLAPVGGQTENTLSLDSIGDTDWFQFPANAGDTLDVTVTPDGLTYLEGNDPAGDLCTSATPLNLNSLALQDLAFEIRDGAGVLTTVNATGAGAAEAVASFAVATTETHYIRVFGTGTDDTQLYNLFVNKTVNDPPVANNVAAAGDEDTTIAWSPSVSDPDGDPLSCSIAGLPAHGGATVAADCSSGTYIPDPDFNGPDSFTYIANDGAADSNVATASITVNGIDDTGQDESVSGEVGPGGTVTSDESGDGATAADPVETSVTSPVPGPVTIEEGSATGPTPTGFRLLGVQVEVTAPTASVSAPLRLLFRLDSSVIPAGEGGATIEVFRDGVVVSACAGSGSASPDPCVANQTGLSDGDMQITVLTSTAGVWSFGTSLPHTVGLVDPTQGFWYLRSGAGVVTSFFYGNPGDIPFVGDWDCDGIDTPGLFRQSDAFAYLRNSNSQGIADIRFFFGNPSDIPLAGDFNNDGCDTLSLYRPSTQEFFIINELGENEGGLGEADFSFIFGNPGDKPVVGDWDGDGVDEIGLHRESTGLFYWRNTLTTGIADGTIFFGNPGDRFVAGDWSIVDGKDTPAVFRPSDTTVYFRHTLTQGNADSQFTFGQSGWLPVAGEFGLG
ncbi:MAG: hypothetical protein BMS9Abin07_0568 [Acidimicrobiia bacterium]|nr:MAG: hypothetical protein BMS9Abin07_0568 [Acidimicrobiia bacterium]